MPLHRTTGLACAAMLALAASAAQAAPSARATELAKRYIAALHMENTMGAMMNNMAPVMLENMAKQRGGDLPSEMKAAFITAAEEATRAIAPRMMEKMIPGVAETFTEAELEAAVTYYESPLGQSLQAKSPAFMAKVTPAVTSLMPEMQADLLARFCRKVDCTEAAAPR